MRSFAFPLLVCRRDVMASVMPLLSADDLTCQRFYGLDDDMALPDF
jgi:hypothetical protein